MRKKGSQLTCLEMASKIFVLGLNSNVEVFYSWVPPGLNVLVTESAGCVVAVDLAAPSEGVWVGVKFDGVKVDGALGL